jgi:hypothetical protein
MTNARRFEGYGEQFGLIWPSVYASFLLHSKKHLDPAFMSVKEPHKLSECLRSPDQEALAREKFKEATAEKYAGQEPTEP